MMIKGFTLIELLVVLAITCLLLFVGAPALSDLSQQGRSRATVINLVGLFSFARQTAISSGKLTTICGSSDQQHCDRAWHKGVMVFIDDDIMGVVDGEDTVIRYEQPATQGTLVWRAFQNKGYLQYQNSGRTNYHNGNLTYCPQSGDLRHARQLIINVTGRVRVARDSDGNGIPNNSPQEDIEC